MSRDQHGVAQIQIGPPVQRTAPRRRRHYAPSWGLKSAMAVTGIVLTAFVAVHLYGNIKVFQGPATFNGYATWLREAFYPLLPKGALLWITRVVLVVSAVVHVVASVIIWVRGRRARGRHGVPLRGARSRAAALMPLTGVAVLGFVVIHLLDLTLGVAPAAPAGFLPPADGEVYAYQNLIASFRRPLAAGLYVAAMTLLSVHIAKGFGTMVVDLGVLGRWGRVGIATVGCALALAVLVGNAAIPIAVQLGWLS